MKELTDIFQTFTPGAYGIWTGVLMFVGWWLKEWRETRKLSLDDRNARREGYAKQVTMLMAENRALGVDLATLRLQHDQYRQAHVAEAEQLRHDIVRLEDRITGFRRTFAQLEISLSRFIARLALGEPPTPESIATLTAILDKVKAD
jgi:hypothetical protein